MQLCDNLMKNETMGSVDHSRTYKIALLISISCVLQISESFIPHPIPGLRLGLANMLTVVALVTLGFRAALEIAVLRTVLSALIMGTFMSPTFILSFSGAVISSLVMGGLYRLSTLHGQFRFSIIGISVFGALTHNMVQLYLAYLLLIKHSGIFIFLPYLCIGAVVMGLVTGIVASSVCAKLEENPQRGDATEVEENTRHGSTPAHFVPGTSFLHRLGPEVKIGALLILSLPLLFSDNLWLYLTLSLFFLSIISFSSVSFAFLVSRMKKYSSFVLIAFFLPLFFNSGKSVLVDMGHFQLTMEGLRTGIAFSFRILFLISLSALLVRTTSPEEMTRGLARLLSPLRILGIPDRRVALILSLSWTALPFCWEAVRNAIRASNVKGSRKMRNLVPALSSMIASLYVEASPGSACWGDDSAREIEQAPAKGK
jgi:heptaprenyl diphosphate synthase